MKKYLSILMISLAVFNYGILTVNAADTGNHATTEVKVTPAETGTSTHTETTSTESGTSEEAEEHATEQVGVVGMFGLNWKLFVAQLVNFGIVLFVLWKWVFKPVTKGLSERTDKIEGSLEEAERIMKDRSDFDTWKKGEISTVRAAATAIITEAKQTAENLKADTLKATVDEQNRLIEQTKARLEQEKALMIDQAKAELADVVVEATGKILKTKIDPVKDKQLIADALKQAQSK